MILAAALLVLVGAGLFVAGLLSGVSVLYWACVAACVVAAVLLIAARRTMTPAASAPAVSQPAAERAKPAEPAVAEPALPEPAVSEAAVPEPVTPPAAGASAAGSQASSAADDAEDPPAEEVEVTDLLLVVDLKDEVLVVDEHPRYHVEGCSWVGSRPTIPLPLDEARTDGFSPCGVCRPDATIADRERARKHSADS